MDHKQAYEMIESYVFGSLESNEFVAVDVHLNTGCVECLERLREIGELSVQLAGGVPQLEAPPRVKDGLFRRIAEEAPVVAPTLREERRRPIGALMGWATAVAATAAAVAIFMWAGSLKEEMKGLRANLDASRVEIARLQQDSSVYTDAARLLGQPCTKLVDLVGVDPNPDAFGKLLMHPEDPTGVVYVYRMPQPPSGMDYQLWFMHEGRPTSMGIFSVAEDGSALLKMERPPNPETIAAFQVTIEPDGGVTEPTGMLYLTSNNTLAPKH